MMGESDRPLFLVWRFIRCHKKNSGAIFFTFTMVLTLVTAILILVHTNDHISRISQAGQMDNDVCCIQDVTKEQVKKIKKFQGVIWYGIGQYDQINGMLKNGRSVMMCCSDNNEITSDSKVIEGRLPQKQNEVVAERWALLDSGIEPVCGTTFKVHNIDSKEENTYKLVGILSEMQGGKEFDMPALYLSIRENYKGHFAIDIRVRQGMNINEVAEKLKKTYHLNKDAQCLYVTKDPKDAALRKLDIGMIILLLAISMIVLYGVYRIALVSRLKEFGVLRAVGMKQRQIRKIVIKELYFIYLASIPAGFGLGYLIAKVTAFIAKQDQQKIYKYNQQVVLHSVVPYLQIGIFIFFMAVFVGMVAYLAGRKISKTPVMKLIASKENRDRNRSYGFAIGKDHGQLKTLFLLGGKYIVKDIKTAIFVILTISLGITLFTGLFYEQRVSQTYLKDTKEFDYLQGQYYAGVEDFNKATDGISRAGVKQIRNMKEVKSVQTAAGMPIRVVRDPKIKTDTKFFKQEDKFYHEFKLHGFDGTDQVYTTTLYGYNQNALGYLKRYVLEGAIPKGGLKEDEIILTCKRRPDIKSPKSMDALDYMLGVPYTLDATFTKAGKPVMQYHAGDKIRMKYREDFNTSDKKYGNLKDYDAKYKYKTYRIAAIVYFNYMQDCTKSSYPLLITSDKQLKKICPNSHIQTMYIDGANGLDEIKQKALEIKLWKNNLKFKQTRTKSVIDEIKKNELLYRKQRVYVMAVVFVTLVIVLLNMYHSLAYRMKVRTKEISILRAIGMSIKMIQKMMLFENGILGVVGILISYLLSKPVCQLVYAKSHMYDFLHPYQFDYAAFAAMAAVVLLICLTLSLFLSKSWKSGEIMERLNQAD